jgi:transposase
MKIAPGFIGIDIAKPHLDIFDAKVGHVVRIDNTPAAIAAMTDSWAAAGAFVLFEATGCYDSALRDRLLEAGIAFARVNPARARAFARAAGFLAKTDAIDARMLAAMAQSLRPQPQPPASAERVRLACLNKRRDQLVATRQQERTRRHEARDADLLASLEAHLAWLDAAIRDLEAQIAAVIAATPELHADRSLLVSAPGVGPVTAATLLALLPELGQRSPKTMAALVGLAPLNRDSGAQRGRRAIQGGRKRVRDALYIAAFAAARHNPRFAAIYQRLRDAGKPIKLALVAIARHLLVILNAMLRDAKPFQA